MSWKKYFTPVNKAGSRTESQSLLAGENFQINQDRQDLITIRSYQISILEHLIV